jgi:hypothetical protein
MNLPCLLSFGLFADNFHEQTDDVTTLLATNDGNFAAACSLDFSSNPKA